MSAVRVAQTAFELEQMERVCRSLSPERILEVGVWHGGTLDLWLHLAGEVVAVDDKMLDAEWWQDWAHAEGSDLTLIQGRSQDPAIVAAVAELGPYDFALIDGDHTYEGVAEDWRNYGPLCKVIAFHDILPREDYGVAQLWAEIKPGRRTIEIVGTEASPDMDNPVAGIGIVFQ